MLANTGLYFKSIHAQARSYKFVILNERKRMKNPGIFQIVLDSSRSLRMTSFFIVLGEVIFARLPLATAVASTSAILGGRHSLVQLIADNR